MSGGVVRLSIMSIPALITVPLTLLLQVFGFLIQFVWAVNIGWLVIDTSWYINWKAINRTSRRQGYAPL